MGRRKRSDVGGGIVLGLLAMVALGVQQYWRELLAIAAVVLVIWLIAKYAAAQREKAEGSAEANSIASPPTSELQTPLNSHAGRLRVLVPGLDVSTGYRPPAPTPAGMGPETFGQRSARSSASPDSVWVRGGTETSIAGFRIPDGLLYVGTNLGAVANPDRVEPALIDPNLRVERGADYRVRLLDYWPSYSAASPQARGAYLTWLADGRRDPAADLGYVFLYFYGLERRALIDAQSSSSAAAEIPAIAREATRLLGIYGDNGSFNRYTASCLDFLSASVDSGPPVGDPAPVRDGYGLPFGHRLALARFSAAGQPLPAPWALAWMRADPTTRLRTPAQRCPDEFRHLFFDRYRAEYGAGMKLPVNKTRLTVSHHPASASFGGRTLQKAFDLPDVSVLSSPVKKLQHLAEACVAQLDGYSRILGRSPDKRGTLDAMLELPILLWPAQHRRNLEQTRDTIAQARRPAAIKFEKLLSWLPDWRDVTKARVSAFATRLGEAGLGMEPDPRFGGSVPEPDSTVVLFADDGKLTTPSAKYSAASLTLHLAAAVSAADGEVGAAERTLLLSQMESWLHLDEAERRRLHAHARWLLSEPPGLSGIRKRVEALEAPARQAIGDFLTQVAQADNEVTPAEVKMLERIFKTLALDTKTLYSKLHVAATAPVTLQAAAAAPRYAIPRPPKPEKATALSIDMAKVAALQAESERVTAILSSIFAAEPSPTAPEPEPGEGAYGPVAPDLMELDAAHSELARLLCTRSQWARVELEELATDRGMMLDGALANINEAAFQTYDQPLSEGDDPVELNPEVVKEILK